MHEVALGSAGTYTLQIYVSVSAEEGILITSSADAGVLLENFQKCIRKRLYHGLGDFISTLTVEMS